ncbi:unnamed protein product [Onchocerca ochengi]|uniref:Uncharacterized protein n=1 Tax=Onchocerca ochengi TaxID=42157 RepID=A0A182EB83_ONCOC|nr:unnamed protein product [Onchocerca ochengi]
MKGICQEKEEGIVCRQQHRRYHSGSYPGLTAITSTGSNHLSVVVSLDRMSQKGRLVAGPVDILRGVDAMSSAADDGADEVKVFRRNDADDVETAQSSHQLTEDKKDVALETELETRTPSSSIIGLLFLKP